MKSKHFLMTAVFGCAMMLMMTSCSKDEDNSTEGCSGVNYRQHRCTLR